MNGMKVGGAIKSLVNAWELCFEWVRGYVLTSNNREIIVRNKRYKSKGQYVQMDNFRGVLGVRKIKKWGLNVLELCVGNKGVNKRINKSIKMFGHMERIDSECINIKRKKENGR